MRTKEGITSNCDQLRNEQYYYDPLAQAPQGVVQPLRTMIRSLDTLNGTSLTGVTHSGSKFMNKSSTHEPNRVATDGWAPEVEILSESELKRLEK